MKIGRESRTRGAGTAARLCFEKTRISSSTTLENLSLSNGYQPCLVALAALMCVKAWSYSCRPS